LAGLTSLKLGSIGAQLGETINEFSSDPTMSGNSNTAVPTEYAVKTYTDQKEIALRAYVDLTNSLDATVYSVNGTDTYDSAGRVTKFTDGDSVFDQIVWEKTGMVVPHYVITKFRQTYKGTTIKVATITYSDSGKISTITIV